MKTKPHKIRTLWTHKFHNKVILDKRFKEEKYPTCPECLERLEDCECDDYDPNISFKLGNKE